MSRGENFSPFLLVDEVDHIMLEHYGDVLYKAQEVPDLRFVQHILVVVWAQVTAAKGRTAQSQNIAEIVCREMDSQALFVQTHMQAAVQSSFRGGLSRR